MISGGDSARKRTYHRSCAGGAAVGGYLLAAVAQETDEVVGCVFFWPPGKSLLSE